MLKPSLHTFVQVCRSGSFTRAAARLFVTPSAVMQQMDSLEKECGVPLLIRSHQGVRPTPAGEYLLEELQVLMHRSGEIRAHLAEIASAEGMITIGTSLVEKCRLLYDLWALYSEKNPACRIQMVNIGADSRIPEVADMVESLNSGIGWMREWRFLEICKVPIGIAMEASHPLARLRTVPPEALAGLQVGTFRGTAYDGLPQLRSQMDALKVEPIWLDYPSASAFWECAFQHRLLLAPLCWSDMMPGLTVRPVRWPFTLPYGIFTRTGLQGEAKRFLDFIRSTYAEGDPNGIVPMLTFE